MAIFRYIAKIHKGREGENLYPGHGDPLLSAKIDEVIDTREDFFINNIKLIFPGPNQND